jgi:hypothetical protein
MMVNAEGEEGIDVDAEILEEVRGPEEDMAPRAGDRVPVGMNLVEGGT